MTAFFAKKIIVPSEATKQAILERFAFINANKISVVPEGVNLIFERKSQQEIEKVRAKYNLGKSRYLFFVSTIQPRKNVPNMIAAFAQYIKENKVEDLHLVLSGKMGWLYEESINAPKKYGVEDKVKFLSATPSEDLPVLFSGATAHLNFSFEEGFGLTLLEAMACGVPCVVSNIQPYKELDMNNFIFVAPTDINSMKDGIAKLLSKSQSEIDELVALGSLNVQRFSWESTAKQTLEILNVQ
jgi:alpha-1,3-rhamnosyl/mannosyltransferase